MPLPSLQSRIKHELVENILPFWIECTIDRENGGFYGALSNDLHIYNDAPRSAVLTARILWTYSAAYRLYGDERYLAMARRARDYIAQKFLDRQNGGVYWTVDRRGVALNDRKHVYAQAFTIYGLAEFYRITGEAQNLQLAQDLFHLIETHTFDPVNGGNLECCSREWGRLTDMRLSEKEPESRKSMNTLLHLMEAYTNLLRVWPDDEKKSKQHGLLKVFLKHIIDPRTHHFKLFFDDEWHSLQKVISPGHDIEGSWLIVEAAEVLGEEDLLARARRVAVHMADAVYRHGLAADGAVLGAITPQCLETEDKEWWPQAEGLVGFTNAFQISGRADFARAADRLWNVIDAHFIDRTHGDWFKRLNADYSPQVQQFKVGPWECPYHHSRACFEMLQRLDGSK
jgi:mannobiose 2-epimerase